MNKNILIGVVALGVLLLAGSQLLNKDKNEEATNESQNESVAQTEGGTDFRNLGVPVHAGETISASQNNNDPEAEWTTVVIKAGSSIADINEWYRSELSSNGWSIKRDQNIGGYQVIQGEKDNLYTTLQASNSEEEGFSTITQQIKIERTTEE